MHPRATECGWKEWAVGSIMSSIIGSHCSLDFQAHPLQTRLTSRVEFFGIKYKAFHTIE